MTKTISVGVSLLVHLLFLLLLLSYIELSHKSDQPAFITHDICISKPHIATSRNKHQLLLSIPNNVKQSEISTDQQARQEPSNKPDPNPNPFMAALNQLMHTDDSPKHSQAHSKPKQAEQLPNFSQIAHGFLNAEQPSLISNKNIKPAAVSANIKFERFAQKLLSAVYNSFKILKRSASLPFAPYGKTYISIELNPDGTLAQSRVSQASSNPYFDHFLLRVIEDAGSIFPPPPSGLEEHIQKLTIIVSVSYDNAMIPRISFSLL